MTIEKITNHAEQAKDRLPDHLNTATQFLDFVDIMAGRTQELEDQLIKLLDERAISTSYGLQLDGIGDILNTPREVGELDTAYQQRLVGVTGELSLSGQIEPLLTVFAALTNPVELFAVEYYPASMLFIAITNADAEDPVIDEGITDAMNAAKAGGVKLDLRYAEETTHFELADESETDASNNGPTSADNGFGDEVLTEGGGLARIIV